MTTDRTAEPSRYRAEFTDVPYAEFPDGTWTVDTPSGGVCTCDGPIDDRERDAKLIAASLTAMEALAAHLNVPAVPLAEVLAGGGLVELHGLIEAGQENVKLLSSGLKNLKSAEEIAKVNENCIAFERVQSRLRTAGQSERGGEG